MENGFRRRPEEQATFNRELLTNIAAATGTPVTAVVRQLVHEVATADELMIDLVRGCYLRQDPVERAGALEEVLGHVRPGVPVTTAPTIAKMWRNRDVFDVATRAATGAILGGLAAEKCPQAAKVLGAVWQEACDARVALRRCGSAAEVVAARLLPHWNAPLADLPLTAAAVAAAPITAGSG